MPQKVLLDTDIGSDIDDAVALAYLLAQPECELLGITTVSGAVVQRAQLASALCKVAGQDIPIFPGRAAPLLIAQRQPHVPQAAALDRWAYQADFPSGEAILFLRQTIRANPGEVVLLAIGPLTNVAALFATDEEIPHMLKSLVLMGGAFSEQYTGRGATEWNILLDPHAAAIVYGSDVKILRSIGLDVTEQVKLDAAQVRRRFQTPLLRPVLDFAEVWFEQAKLMTFHDPLAAATLFDEQICQFERGHVDIELISQDRAGLTYWQAHHEGLHEVATSVDGDRFFEHYFAVVK